MNLSPSHRLPVQPSVWISGAQRDAFDAEKTTAHRLASGNGGWVERLGDDVLISYKQDEALADMLRGLESWCTENQWTAARIFTRFLPLKNDERISPVLHSGDESLPLTTVVTEAGVSYSLDFTAGYSHGLFLDQRANRARLAVLKPKRMLNTFAYTCSFSVVAAMAGAQTTSIDLSRKSLDRGVQNFELNTIPETGHRFMADDALELLPKLGNRGERFDAIILDPPTFSRGNNGRRWQVEQHFEDLILAALEVAMPKCAILLSTNCLKLTHAILEQRARACAKVKRRAVDITRTMPLVDFPAGHGSSTVWMMVR